MKHLGLFEGIGGFSLAARWIRWETIAWCEWNEFGQKVLRHHFPNAEGFSDITKSDFKKYANKIDIITGGFPCQPFSLAGKRKGTDDERYLWGEMLRAIQEVKPKYVIAENVFGITNISDGLVFEQVCIDLENEGYEVQPFILPAAAKDAPHRRDRVWFVAYSNGNGFNERNGKHEVNTSERGLNALNDIEQNDIKSNTTNSQCEGLENRYKTRNISSKKGKTRRKRSEFTNDTFTNGNDQCIFTNTNCGRQSCKEYGKKKPGFITKKNISNYWQNFPTQSPICNGDDGIPNRLVNITFPKWRNESIKAMGNAIVPQVAFELFKVIQEIDNLESF